MSSLLFFKEILVTIVAITTILGAIAGFIFFLIKESLKRGRTFQLFETLVDEVSKIKDLIDKKFIDNDKKHQKHTDLLHDHDTRLTKLEVVTHATNFKKTK